MHEGVVIKWALAICLFPGLMAPGWLETTADTAGWRSWAAHTEHATRGAARIGGGEEKWKVDCWRGFEPAAVEAMGIVAKTGTRRARGRCRQILGGVGAL